MKKLLSLIFSFAAFTLLGVAQSKEEKNVAQAVETLRKAMIDGNKNVLEIITVEKLSYGHSNGNIENKTAFMEALTSGKSDFVSMDLTEQTIAISGNTALVRHKLFAETKNNGTPGTVKLSVLLVFLKEKGEWKLLARQAVKI